MKRWKREKPFIKFGELLKVPDLISVQKESYRNFLMKDIPPDKRPNTGLQGLFKEIFPIESFNEKLVLDFVEYTIGEPKYPVEECLERGLTYSAPLKVKLRLIYRETGEVKEQEVFMRNIPLMTDRGTFVVNGAERVIVSQIHRSPGVYYSCDPATRVYSGKIIPYKGAWIEFQLDVKDMIYVRIARKRRIPYTLLLRAMGFSTNEDILKLYFRMKSVRIGDETKDIEGLKIAERVVSEDTGEVICSPLQTITQEIIERLKSFNIKRLRVLDEEDVTKYSPLISTLQRDTTSSQEEALIKLYNLMRPGEPANVENARQAFERMFFDLKRYDLERVGRYKINTKFGLNIDLNKTTLQKEDVVEALRYLLKISSEQGEPDDIDHLGNRRVRPVGELFQNQLRTGMARLEKRIRERMTIQEIETVTPQSVVNIKPLTSAINEFFGSSRLSQFMDQTNPLSELTHKRRLSALGRGGLNKQRAGFEVRDIHYTHYGRVCPIETPEGPNIGLIVSLSIYARLDEFGFIKTPYRKVENGVVTNKIDFLSASEEDNFVIAQLGVKLDEDGKILDKLVAARCRGDFPLVPPDQVDYIDVSHMQLFSVSTALIPFLEHDDANRALMGSNMQRQAVPLLITEAPLVGTGMEREVAKNSGAVILAEFSGVCERVTANEIVISGDGRKKTYKLLKYKRSNQSTCITQYPIVKKGQKVEKGDILTDGTATYRGELALGRNLLVAFMCFEGYNFEDAIVLSERLVQEDVLTSIHIERFEIEARDTTLGPESITRDIPNLGEEALRNLDERGIARIGAEVRSGDILVGRVTPKGETDLSPEYKLLHSIFGEKAREVRDTSLRLPYGKDGVVVEVKVFTKQAGDELPAGVEELVRVYIANKRKISVGDKLAGRHGNKGVVSKILPVEDMPYLPDGTPVDIILNPLSVPSRMNLGQILETHLGWAAHALGTRFYSPIFIGATFEEIQEMLEEAGLPKDGKTILYDGRTGEPFDQKVTCGYIYIVKLNHLVEDKIHARSTGPYSLVTQQPLGGKAQFGGQRLGEMEVWALEAYGAAYCLQEMLTVKSDDIIGRAMVYEAIIKGENPFAPGIPESFHVLVRELQGLCLDVGVIDEKGEMLDMRELSAKRKGIEEAKAVDLILRKKAEEK
jgi:DNA-directed RNA polymerase subunit beta